MSGLRPSRPSAGLVVSIIALIVALGGTSYAAFTLPSNSVGTKQIKNKAITGAKIATGAITGSNINLGTLGTVPLANNANHAGSADSATNAANALNASHASSADNATNAAHANSADNATSATTASAVGGVQYIRSQVSYVLPGHLGSTWVVCPSGLEVSGGGVEGDSGNPDESIQGSYPYESGQTNVPNAWRAYVNNTGALYSDGFWVYAICVPESNPTSQF